MTVKDNGNKNNYIMKINKIYLNQEKEVLERFEKAKSAYNEQKSQCCEDIVAIVERLNKEWADYIGKLVDITCQSKYRNDSQPKMYRCFFNGFVASYLYLDVSQVCLSLYETKKDGTQSKRRLHLGYYPDEIIDIELAE